MNFKKLIQDIKPHAIVLLGFFLFSYIYYIKTFQGLVHNEMDVTQGKLKGTELAKYTTEDGEFPGWTNSIFSGMPSVMIKGKPSGNYIKYANYLTPMKNTEYPFQIMLLSFVAFYMLLQAFKVKPKYAAVAALVYGLATFSISSVEAAHYTKVLSMAMIPAVFASMHWLFNGRYFLGGITLAFNFALQTYFFHYQITFYTIICLLVLGIYYLVTMVKENKVKQLITATLISIVAIGGGVLSNVSKIKSTSHFAENTMRGGNDLAKASDTAETGKTGLERDYAFNWSYGKVETMTILIPGFVGGSTREKLTDNSNLYKALESNYTKEDFEQATWPLYHGAMRNGTSGPIYIGAIVMFLFLLGMIVIKDKIKWALLTMTVISFILGWGENFGIVNNLLFDYLPYFDKFRTPMMAFCIAQVTIPLVGFLGLKQLYENWKLNKTNNDKKINTKASLSGLQGSDWENIKIAFYVVGGICAFFALLGPMFLDFSGAFDETLKRNGFTNIMPILKEDRASLLRKDSLRSLIYIALAFGAFWAWYSKKIEKNTAVLMICGLAAIDLLGVDWRYLNWSSFNEKKEERVYVEDNADKAILADKDLHYRVYDLTDDPFNDNNGAAFHKMIGGYDPAKLSRYQDVIAEILVDRKYADKGLNMLNCKYIIGKDSTGRGVIPRGTNNGNVWYVSSLKSAKDARAEMDLLKSIDNKTAATFNLSFELNKDLKDSDFPVDSNAYARLVKYHPDTMLYEVNNANKGYLVFSEIFYDDWRVEIDGKPATLNKVDYTLRGLAIDAGKHNIKMYFNKNVATTDTIEKVVSITILIGMGVLMILWLVSYTRKQEA